jgi:hypothetical protein
MHGSPSRRPSGIPTLRSCRYAMAAATSSPTRSTCGPCVTQPHPQDLGANFGLGPHSKLWAYLYKKNQAGSFSSMTTVCIKPAGVSCKHNSHDLHPPPPSIQIHTNTAHQSFLLSPLTWTSGISTARATAGPPSPSAPLALLLGGSEATAGGRGSMPSARRPANASAPRGRPPGGGCSAPAARMQPRCAGQGRTVRTNSVGGRASKLAKHSCGGYGSMGGPAGRWDKTVPFSCACCIYS